MVKCRADAGGVHVECRPVGVSIAVGVSFFPVVTFKKVSLVLCAWPSREGPETPVLRS